MLALVLIPLVLIAFAMPVSIERIQYGRDNIVTHTTDEIRAFQQRLKDHIANFREALIASVITIGGLSAALWLLSKVLGAIIRSFFH